MKIHNETSDVQIIGDINSNKVGIDANNIDFITTILSTNLYSNPIKSLIRETVSNAWDSHIEKGCKKPILIELNEEFKSENIESKYYFRVRDFGVGLTKKRFDTIYRNIGSSTKRSDNQQIGGWGLGRFAPLSYTNTVYITSYAEGIKTKYIMYKDNNSIKIDELFSDTLTEDETGLEIFIYVEQSDIIQFCTSLCTELLYFDNIFISSNLEERYENYYQNCLYNEALNDLQTFNSITYATYNTFKISSQQFQSSWNKVKCSILLGNVQYPIKWSMLDDHYKKYSDYPIAIKFNIGELDVTPNREELLYNDHNINKIHEKFNEFENELNDLIQQNRMDYTDPFKYFVNMYSNAYILKLNNNISLKINSSLSTYKGINIIDNCDLPTITRHIENILCDVFGSNFSIWQVGENINHMKINHRYNFHQTLINNLLNKKIINCNVIELKPFSKSYLKEQCDYSYCIYNHKNKLNDIYNQYVTKYVNTLNRTIPSILQLFLSDLCNEIEKAINALPTFDNTNVPIEYIKKYKEARKTTSTNIVGVNWTSEINVYYQRYLYEYHKTWNTERIQYSEIANKTKGVTIIYGAVSNEDVDKAYCYFISYLRAHHTTFWKIADTKIKLIEKLNLSNFIPIDVYLQQQKSLIIKDYTAQALANIIPRLNGSLNLYNLSSYTEVNDFYIYCKQYYKNHNIQCLFNSYYHSYDLKKYFITNIDPEQKPENIYDPEMFQFLKDNDKILKAIQLLTILDIDSTNRESQAYLLSTLKEKHILTLNEKDEELIQKYTIFKTL